MKRITYFSFGLLIIFFTYFTLLSVPANAGNERDSVLNLGISRQNVVTTHINPKNAKTINKGSHSPLKRQGIHSSSSAIQLPGTFKFESHNEIENDITVHGDSELIIGGISRGNSDTKNSNNDTNDTIISPVNAGETGSPTNGIKPISLPPSQNNSTLDTGITVSQDKEANAELDRLQTQLDQLEQAEDMLRLADNAYRKPRRSVPDGWKPLEADDIRALGLKPEDFRDDKSGFSATLFYNEKNGEYVLAFRGTEIKSLRDWGTDIDQARGYGSDQYIYAARLATVLNVKLKGKKLSFTGHSLGGGLASIAALQTGKKAIVFNAATIDSATFVEVSADLRKLHVEDGVTKNIPILEKIDRIFGPVRTIIADHYGIGDNVEERLKVLVTNYTVEGEIVSNGVFGDFNHMGREILLPPPETGLKIATKLGISIDHHGVKACYDAITIRQNQTKEMMKTLEYQ